MTLDIDSIHGRDLLDYLDQRMDDGAKYMTKDKSALEYNYGFETAVLGFHAIAKILRGEDKGEAMAGAYLDLLDSHIRATA